MHRPPDTNGSPGHPPLTDREALELRDAQLRGILGAASEAILTIDASQTIVMANRMAAQVFGRSTEALIGLPLEALLPPRLRAAHRQAVAGFGATDAPPRRMGRRGGLVGLRANGEEFPLEAGISQAHADGQRLYTVILRDLTEAQRTAGALRSSEALLAATFSAGSVGMAQLDPSTRRFLAVNPAFCALSGYDASELAELTADRLAPAGEVACTDPVGPTEADLDHWDAERRLQRKDGSVIWVEVSVGVARDAGGRPERLVCVARDVTGHRLALAALRASEARLAFLVRLNDRLRECTAPEDIGREAAVLLRSFVDAHRVGYAEDAEGIRAITMTRSDAHDVPALGPGCRYLEPGSALAQALHDGHTVVQPDVAADPALTSAQKAAHAALGIGATVDVPLLQNGCLVGVLFVHAHAPRRWTPDEVALFEDVAARVRADIVRARAEAGVRATKAKLEAALASMNDAVCISDAAGVITDVNAAFFSFHRLRGAAHPRSIQEYPALLEITRSDGSVAPLDDWAIPRALRGESGTNLEYTLRDRRSGERWIASYSFAPILDGEGRIVGSVCSARDITDARRVRARLEASQTELRRLVTAQNKVQEQERLRIARELHDDLQQELAAILMEVEVLRGDVRAVDGHVRETLDRIERLCTDVIASMRRIVHDLRPQALEELGPVAAIQALARTFGERSGIDCQVEVSGFDPGEPVDLAPVATCLYRLAQEALNNVARHARARRVQIRLQHLPPTQVRISVADDGVGIRPHQLRQQDSFGLLGMRERVRAFGGTLVVRSDDTGGTLVEAVIPIDPAAGPMRD